MDTRRRASLFPPSTGTAGRPRTSMPATYHRPSRSSYAPSSFNPGSTSAAVQSAAAADAGIGRPRRSLAASKGKSMNELAAEARSRPSAASSSVGSLASRALAWTTPRKSLGPSSPSSGLSRPSARGPAATPRLKRWYRNTVDLPSDTYFAVTTFSLLDWFDDPDAIARPAGLGLNVAHAGVKVIKAMGEVGQKIGRRWSGSASGAVGSRLEAARKVAESHRGSWLGVTTMLSLFMVFLSFVNAYYLFTSCRTYRMHLRSDPLSSPNARLIPDPSIEPPPKPTLIQRLAGLSRLLFGWPKQAIEAKNEREVVELKVWEPLEVCLRVFVLYPPPNALLLHFVSFSERLWVWGLAMAAIVAQTHWIVTFYKQLVKDKQLVQREVMAEYDVKFVGPRVFKRTMERGVMTNFAETVRREDWLTY